MSALAPSCVYKDCEDLAAWRLATRGTERFLEDWTVCDIHLAKIAAYLSTRDEFLVDARVYIVMTSVASGRADWPTLAT